MKYVSVVQHTQSDWLGLIEDHLEGRRIRFGYSRPFSAGGSLPKIEVMGDALILLGLGPWGAGGTRDVPTLEAERTLARACLMLEKPIIGFGLGAQILSLAGDGTVDGAPLSFSAGHASRVQDSALNGYLPERYPNIVYGFDRAVPPAYAQILAEDDQGYPALFQIGTTAFGFSGHPGVKLAMIEDLLMESNETPDNTASELEKLRALKTPIEDALVSIMTGLVQMTGLMKGQDD
ncbi:MAG: hypothetical protein ACR2OX_07995 [Methyloligellaceae bacterium]